MSSSLAFSLGLTTSTAVPSGPIVLRLLVAMSVVQARASADGSLRESMPGESASTLVQNSPASVRDTVSRLV